jgi:SIR2-like domain
MELDTALEHALDGRALLFTGAGFSRGAVCVGGGNFKTAGQFANKLAKQVGLPEGTPLDDTAEEFASRMGEDRLIAEIRSEFTARVVSKSQEIFATVPWKRIYTTNYDDVIEHSYAKAGRGLTSVTISDQVSSIPVDLNSTLCIHLNGFVGKLTRATIWTEAKITDTSYLTSSLAESPWAAVFREDVEVARAIFFVGYSLPDLDIRRILFHSNSLQEKSFFVVGDKPTPSTLSRAKRFGEVLHYGAEKIGRPD